MSHELFYTSAPKGLRPGSRGFCTVAATPGLPLPLTERVESLSGYRPLYPPLDAKGHLNPVVHSHLRFSVGGKTYSVLSRISPAGLDYSQRANKFAHHVILEAGELPAAGPAWLLAQPGFMESQWDGEVRVLPSGRLPPEGDGAPAVCRCWQEATGDAGWGGVLADWFERDLNRHVYLLFEPGLDVLPLIAETVALLPVERRWQVSFSTYFTGLPQGIPCLWRSVVKDSPEANNASRLLGQQVLNLCEPLGPAPAGNWVEQARSGRKAGRVTVPGKEPASTRNWPGGMAGGPRPEDEGIVSHSPSSLSAPDPGGRYRGGSSSYEMEPIPKGQGSPAKSAPTSLSPRPESVARASQPKAQVSRSKTGKRSWLWAALAGLLVGLGAGSLMATFLLNGPSSGETSRQSLPKENEARAAELVEDEKEIKSLEKQVRELKAKNQAKDKDLQDVNAFLLQTKSALAKETEKRAKLESEKKDKEKTIAELQDELRKQKDQAIAKPLDKLPDQPASVAGYLRLPEWSKSSFSENKLRSDKDVRSFGLEADKDYNLRLAVSDSSHLQSVEGVSSIKVRLQGGKDLAKFELKDGKLSFQWYPQAEAEYEKAQALLREGVLEIGSAGKTQHIALREPIYEKETEVAFPFLGKIGLQDAYRNTGDFMTWDYQGPPSQPLLFDFVRLEIDNQEPSKPTRFEKKAVQTVLLDDPSKQFKWGVIAKPQDSSHVGSLTLGPSNPFRKPTKVRILSLVAYIEVHGVFIEVARIGKLGKR